MNLYDSIGLAHKFTGGSGSLVEAAQAQQLQQPDKTTFAVGVVKRLNENKPREAKPVQLNSFPVPN